MKAHLLSKFIEHRFEPLIEGKAHEMSMRFEQIIQLVLPRTGAIDNIRDYEDLRIVNGQVWHPFLEGASEVVRYETDADQNVERIDSSIPKPRDQLPQWQQDFKKILKAIFSEALKWRAQAAKSMESEYEFPYLNSGSKFQLKKEDYRGRDGMVMPTHKVLVALMPSIHRKGLINYHTRQTTGWTVVYDGVICKDTAFDLEQEEQNGTGQDKTESSASSSEQPRRGEHARSGSNETA
jgi:hypothetical protein